MAKDQEPVAQPWGTLEELLLACAVNRHGTKSWDSIAMEVQTRTSALSSLTPQSCRHKFNDLKRRFMSSNDVDSPNLVPMVDQLRQIRVQELRAEVQRRDVSIVSLELKVKRLKEERERHTDLGRDRKTSPDIVAGKTSAVDGESDDRDNRSFNESNSTNQKGETNTKKQNDAVKGGEKESKTRTEPEKKKGPDPVRREEEPDRERDWSSNGKLEGGRKGNDGQNDKTGSAEKKGSKKGKRSSESNESKREGGKQNQSSDVQSSASLSKKKRRRNDGGGGAVCGSGEEPEGEGEEVSPATKKKLAVKSEPLIRIIAMIRSHRLGSQFERRLRSQESDRYKKLIKQHIDIRTILSRVERGFYSDSLERFFRDLLLLFTNFILFFKKTSQEYAAAHELRALVIKDMSDKLRKKPTVDKHPNSKSTRHSTIVPCSGLRSSVKAKSEIPAASTSKKGDNSKKEKEIEEKPKVNQQKKVEDLSLGRDEHNNRTSSSIKKKRSDERSSVSGRKNPRSSSSNNSKSVETKHKCGGNELSSHDMTMYNRKEKDKVVKTTTTTATVNSNTNKKKQGVASFLKRMKQNSPSEVAADEEEDEDEGKDEDEVESQDDASKNDEDEEEEEQEKKRQGKKNEVRRVTRSSRGGGGGRVVEKEGSGKSRRAVSRTTGGSNKRSSTGGPPETRMGKRGRETNVGGKSEVGRSKKRTRR